MSYCPYSNRCGGPYRRTRNGIWVPQPSLSMVAETLPPGEPIRLHTVPTGYLVEVREGAENGEVIRRYMSDINPNSALWVLLTWVWGVDPYTEPELVRRYFPEDEPTPTDLIPELEDSGLLLPWAS